MVESRKKSNNDLEVPSKKRGLTISIDSAAKDHNLSSQRIDSLWNCDSPINKLQKLL